MANIRYEIVCEIGPLSSRPTPPQFNLVEWNGCQKYDIRRWDNSGAPLKGVTINVDDIGDFGEAINNAIKYEYDEPDFIFKGDKYNAKIYGIFYDFGSKRDMTKYVTLADWGRGICVDLRPWSKDFEICGKGISLTFEECETLLWYINDITGKPLKGSEPDPEPIPCDSFLICKSTLNCCARNHNLHSITAYINVLKYDGTIETFFLPAGYCENCGYYFIKEMDYLYIRKKGVLLCKVVSETMYNRNPNLKEIYLPEESIYHQFGYNVNGQDNLSNAQRQGILAFFVDNNIRSKFQIADFIERQIVRNANKKSDMSSAIAKWEEDRKYIMNYEKGSRAELVAINAIATRRPKL